MRRPALTRAQRQHAREMRALLRLRRAAVRYSCMEPERDRIVELLADLEAACDAYTNALPERERRKLAREP